MGIPVNEREKLFDLQHSKTEGGAGLGLRIISRVVEGHDWDITVGESSSGGARFEITGIKIT